MDNFKTLFISIIISLFLIPSILLSQNIPLSIGVTTYTTQDKSSTVRYAVDFPEPCEINIEVIGWQSTYNWGTDYDRIYVYNSSNEIIGRNQQSYESDKFLFHMISDTANLKTRIGMEGTYYIDFHSGNNWGWPAGKENQSYSILVTVENAIDTNESNDSMGSAKGIILGEIVFACQWERVATNSVSGDEDWYRIDLTSPGILSLEIKDWVPTQNWGMDYDRFYIYNNNGDAIGVKSSNENDPYSKWMLNPETDLIDIYLTAGGSFYLRFHSGAGYSHKGYTLSSSFVPIIDTFEPNNNLDQAKEIQLGTWYNAYQWRSADTTTNIRNDEDYYKLTVQSEGELVITLNDWTATYNWGDNFDRMYIYDVNGSPLGSTGTDPYYDWMMGGGNTTKINLPGAGDYFVRLHSGSGYSTEPYKILFEFNTSTTDIDTDNELEIPQDYSLYQNYPNPFNPSTKIKYSVKETGQVTVKIYDLIGNEVMTLLNEITKSPGYYDVSFEARNLTSGFYFYTIRVNDFYDVKKMILVK